MIKKEKIKHFNSTASQRDHWKRKNKYYYSDLEKLLSFIVPPNCTLLEIGCGTGDLVGRLKPSWGIGIDFSLEMIKLARRKYPDMTFVATDAECLGIKGKFDYVIMSDLVGHLFDIWKAFREIKKVTKPKTRIIITYHNFLWEPLLKLGEKIGLKMRQEYLNWLSLADIENLLSLNDFEVVKAGKRLLFPKKIPLLSTFINKHIATLPIIKGLCLINYIVARQKNHVDRVESRDYSCSIIIPCKDEAGNIENAVTRIPQMGRHVEIIFVDGNSMDGTVEKIQQMMDIYKGRKDIKLIHQGKAAGKGDAVRKGFAKAQGDIFMILDADLTVPPEDLPKFYLALAEGKAEFINGSRLVYMMEKQAMRTLNLMGNKLFSWIFTWILEQRIKDTLCGTKALFKEDYEKIVKNRSFFGDFDPFGDFDLLFGAAKLNLKIAEMPIRYKARVYGEIKISRFKHGWLLVKMSSIALKKFKWS